MVDTPILPTRLIACIDGTWCTPDGQVGKGNNNISNIYRICASVKVGECKDESSGTIFNQEKRYYKGIGSEEDIGYLRKLEAGAFGTGFQDQIREVYEHCCMLSSHPQNEVWLYGFSRGAYVVRAVASLLHYLRALTSAGTPAFKQDYEDALKMYRNMQRQSKLMQAGEIHSYIRASTRDAPKIRFLGLLDTVKAVDDQSLHEISFNRSIQHLRHALALNEDRRAFSPEYIYPDYNQVSLFSRSIIQAWFVGAHIDIGGSAAKDGLALYPLQWMLLESRSKGLALQFDGSFGGRAHIDNPLDVVFPNTEQLGKGHELWYCKAKNGMMVGMQDLRLVHDHKKYGERYAVHLNRRSHPFMRKKVRRPFSADGILEGYCDYDPHGTILHPSVYLVFDEYCHVLLDTKELTNRKQIEHWRPALCAEEFWIDRGVVNIAEPGAIRVLVCGNTGVGKSTLINEVFGAEVTAVSARKRGVHNIADPMTSPDRPDLIIHDSGGFESGGTDELQQVKEFVTDLSNRTDVTDRLHVIWFCIEIGATRTRQNAAMELFATLSQNARETPIVIIGTKKDEFLNMQYGKARKLFSNEEDREAHAEKQLRERLALIEEELLEIEGGKCDTMVSVSKDDKESIRTLTAETSRCFDHVKVRKLYIAAQVTRIDLKVELAMTETMRLYRLIVRSAAGAAFVPLGSSSNRVTVSILICKAIVGCFGTPRVSAVTIQEIVKSIVWDDLEHNLSIAFAEAAAVIGIGGSIILGGAPIFLVSGVVNMTFAVPATARLFLMLACDIILILTRAYKACTDKCLGQPLKKDIENAAFAYRYISKGVHRAVKDLLPRVNFIGAFKAKKIEAGFEEILERYKREFTEELGTNLSSSVSNGSARSLSTPTLGHRKSSDSTYSVASTSGGKSDITLVESREMHNLRI